MPKNKLFSAIDKAPLPGKTAVEEIYVGYDTSSDKYRHVKALGAGTLMIAIAAAHGYQMKFGADSLATHLPEMLEHGNLHDIAYTAVDTSFIALNAAVATRQASLTGKIAQKHAKWIREKDIIPEAHRKKERRARNKKAFAISALAGIAVGAAGQGAVTLSLHDAHDQVMDNKVKEFIQEHADDNDVYESNVVFLPPKSNTQHTTSHDAPH